MLCFFPMEERMCVLTKSQVAQLLKVSPRTIDYWRSNYGLPTVKIGQVCRFHPDLVLDWFDSYLTGSRDFKKEGEKYSKI